jgi:hypothetical protein
MFLFSGYSPFVDPFMYAEKHWQDEDNVNIGKLAERYSHLNQHRPQVNEVVKNHGLCYWHCPVIDYITTTPNHSENFTLDRPNNYFLVLSREWGNGMIIDSYYGSFPHSLLSTKSNCWVNEVFKKNGLCYWHCPLIDYI